MASPVLIHVMGCNSYEVPRKASTQEADILRFLQRSPTLFIGHAVMKLCLRSVNVDRQMHWHIVFKRCHLRQQNELIRCTPHHSQYFTLSLIMADIGIYIIVFIQIQQQTGQLQIACGCIFQSCLRPESHVRLPDRHEMMAEQALR